MNMWKRLAVGCVAVVVVYAVLPANAIDVLGKFAIGWMLMDIVNTFFDR